MAAVAAAGERLRPVRSSSQAANAVMTRSRSAAPDRVQAVAQVAGLVQAGHQAFQRGHAAEFEPLDDRHCRGLGAGQDQQVPYQGRVGGPDPGPGDDDLAQRLDRVGTSSADSSLSKRARASRSAATASSRAVTEAKWRYSVARDTPARAATSASASGCAEMRTRAAAASMICWRVRATASALADMV